MTCEELRSISNSTVLLSNMLKYAVFNFEVVPKIPHP